MRIKDVCRQRGGDVERRHRQKKESMIKGEKKRPTESDKQREEIKARKRKEEAGILT